MVNPDPGLRDHAPQPWGPTASGPGPGGALSCEHCRRDLRAQPKALLLEAMQGHDCACGDHCHASCRGNAQGHAPVDSHPFARLGGSFKLHVNVTLQRASQISDPGTALVVAGCCLQQCLGFQLLFLRILKAFLKRRFRWSAASRQVLSTCFSSFTPSLQILSWSHCWFYISSWASPSQEDL